MSDEVYYTLKEVCFILKINKSTLYWWRRRGMLNVSKLGTSKNSPVRVSKSELDRVMTEAKQ